MGSLYSAPSKATFKVSTFKGIDVSKPEDQIQEFRAAKALNMIPDATGEVRKRPGIQAEKAAPWPADLEDGAKLIGFCNGVHPIYEVEGKEYPYRIYCRAERTGGAISLVLTAYAKECPVAVPYEDKTFVFMGEGLAVSFTGTTAFQAGLAVFLKGDDCCRLYTDGGAVIVTTTATTPIGSRQSIIAPDDPYLTTPIFMQGCDPGEGGTPLDAINLLNPWATESFLVKDEVGACVFHLTNKVVQLGEDDALYGEDAAAVVRAQVLCKITDEETNNTRTVWVDRPLAGKAGANGDGVRFSTNWVYLSKDHNTLTDVTIDGTEFKTFNVGTSASGTIGATPLEGEDNVRITYWRADFAEGFRAVCGAVCATAFGVGGYKDRLFLGGVYAENRVYYSELADPLYIADINFIETEAGSRVMALDGVASELAILTDKGIVFAQGAVSNGEDVAHATDALFSVSHCIKAPAPLNSGNTAVLGGEVVYLSKEGIVAVAAKEHYDSRYAEYRSATVNRMMMKDGPQRILNVGRYLLVFCDGGICWLFDENQPNTEGDKPYASHQYEGFRMDGFACDHAYTENGVLKLVRGKEIHQWMDGSAGTHYHDGTDQAIIAWWETPWLLGNTFYRRKIFMKLGVFLGKIDGANTSIKVEGKKNNEDWKLLWGYDGTLCTFNYGTLDYRLFTYQRIAGCANIVRKIKIKKALKFKLRFTNEFFDQPFILREFGLDFVQED